MALIDRARPNRGVLRVALAGGLLIGAALAGISKAADKIDDDLVNVTPQKSLETPEKEDDEDLLTHALRNAHGEVGAMIGTGGTRGVYGTVTMPLGENGSLTLSGSTLRSNAYAFGDPRFCDRRALTGVAPRPLGPDGTPCALADEPFLR